MKTKTIYATCGACLLLMALACGGSGAGAYEGTWCREDEPSQCVTLNALQGGTAATDLQGDMNTISLGIGPRTSSASECSWSADRPGCDFVFGPSTITRPPNAPITTIEFHDGFIVITGAAQPEGAHGGTHWVRQ